MGSYFHICVRASSPPDLSGFGCRLEPVPPSAVWPRSVAYPRGVTHRVVDLYSRHFYPEPSDPRICNWQWLRPLFVKLLPCERVWAFSDYSPFDEHMEGADRSDPQAGGAEYAVVDESTIEAYDAAFLAAGHTFEAGATGRGTTRSGE